MNIARDRGVPVIDIYAHFKDKEEYLENESNFNEEGYRMCAKLISDHIIKQF